MRTLLLASALFALTASAAPTMSLRLRGPHTATMEQWNRTCAAIAANPGCCDEVWFSTGIGVPPLAWHREQVARLTKASADLRRLGIVPSLQVQATLGHSDSLSACEDCSAKAWTGWTGSKGVEDRYCNCPRQPAFLAYVRDMSRAYATLQPGSVWIDDDLRIHNHTPATQGSRLGCWCATCLADFNAQENSAWSREELDAAVGKDPALAARWKAFSVSSIATVARVIAAAFHEVSPETRMAFQHCFSAADIDSVKAIGSALHAASGQPVGLRPGGGFYYDVNPSDQVVKSITAAAFRRQLGDPKYVDVWCPEVESWPRAYGSRSAQSALVESFTALMYGFNATSLLLLDTRYETDELYSRTILKPLADAAPVLKGYVSANAGTVPAGFAAKDLPAGRLYRWAICGVPVLPGVGRGLGELAKADLALDVCTVGSKTVQELRDGLDARAGGSPAVVESPFVGLIAPRVTAEGEPRTVALLNTRIDAQGPVTLRLRGVPASAKAVWRELRRPPLVIDISRAGDVARVTIPEIGAWNAGYLDFTRKD